MGFERTTNASNQLGRSPLLERYHEILRYRREGLRKYGGRIVGDLRAAPTLLTFPSVRLREPTVPHLHLGPVHIIDNPPLAGIAAKVVRSGADRQVVLEIGPGVGTLASQLQEQNRAKISEYFGLELDPTVRGPYVNISDLSSMKSRIDLVIASEVVEHMTFEQFFGDMLSALLPLMAPNASIVVGTPNALAPGAIFRDFSHVQGYAWYDLYGLLRLSFEEVDVYRTWYGWSPWKLLWLIPRILITQPLELDWCEGVVCVGRFPRTV